MPLPSLSLCLLRVDWTTRVSLTRVEPVAVLPTKHDAWLQRRTHRREYQAGRPRSRKLCTAPWGHSCKPSMASSATITLPSGHHTQTHTGHSRMRARGKNTSAATAAHVSSPSGNESRATHRSPPRTVENTQTHAPNPELYDYKYGGARTHGELSLKSLSRGTMRRTGDRPTGSIFLSRGCTYFAHPSCSY